MPTRLQRLLLRMAKISMNRAIHEAVRRDLRRFLDALEDFPDGSRDRAAQLARAWANFEHQLTDHHESEHEIVWPALGAIGASRELTDTMDSEHGKVAAALSVTRGAMAQLKSSASAAEALTVRAELERLQDVTLEHFEHEERDVEPISSAHRDAPEVHEIARRFGRRLTPPKVAVSSPGSSTMPRRRHGTL